MVDAARASRSTPAASASRPRCRPRTPTATASRCRRAGRSHDEVLALCDAVGEHAGTTLEGIVRRLPRPVQRRRDRAAWRRCRPPAQRPAQLERAHRRLAACPSAIEHQLAGVDARRARRAAQVVALTMPMLVADEHELPQLLRAVHHPGLGRRPRTCRSPSASRSCAIRRRAGNAGRAGASARSRRVPPPRRLRPLRHRRHVLRGQRGAEGHGSSPTSPTSGATRPVRHPRRRSCSADELRTVLWPHADRRRRRVWSLRARCGRTTRRADRRLRRRRPPRPHVRRAVHRPRSSATASAAASSCRSSRPCS